MPETEHFVFNGDGDGLCALQQLRLHRAATPANLITGTKRDIEIVKRVKAAKGDIVTVLDVSFRTNAAAVAALLRDGAIVRYFDHHDAGELVEHPQLEIHINPSADTCTSLIVNAYLGGSQRLWAAVGAWADNLEKSAQAAVSAEMLSAKELDTLRELGACLNYNSYGDREADLLITPLELHRHLIRYSDPREFCRKEPLFGQLCTRMAADLSEAESVKALTSNSSAAVFLFPNSAWARRVSGVWSNELVNRYPLRAHAVLAVKPGGGYVVSVRAPHSRPWGAAELCRKYPSGGGRAAAAGINHLPAEGVNGFCAEFLKYFEV